MSNYYEQYLKYKLKYIKLKNKMTDNIQHGKGIDDKPKIAPKPVLPRKIIVPDVIVPGVPVVPGVIVPGVPGVPDVIVPGVPDVIVPGVPGVPVVHVKHSKKIFILYCSKCDSRKNKIDQNHTYCNTEIKYNFNIKDLVLKVDDKGNLDENSIRFFTFMNKKDTNFNKVLVYFNRDKNKKVKLDIFLKLIDTNLKNVTFYYHSSTDYFDKSPLYNNLKILNIRNTDDKILSKQIDIQNNCLLVNPINSYLLICQPWFEYFAENAFTCIAGRLQQISGTCYLNAILNGFILSNTARKIILNDMNTKKNTLDTELYKKPISIDICEITKDYFYRLVYNMLCIGKHLELERDTDYIQNYSKLFYEDKDGGEDLPTIIRIFDDIYPNYILFIESEYNKIITKGTLDFYIYHGSIHSEHKKPLLNIEYDIEFSVINIIFKDDKGHAVVGYICENIYKIYDSNNYLYDFEWIHLMTDANLMTELKKKFSTIYKKEVSYIYIELLIYVKKSVKEQYTNIFVNDLCMKLI